MVDSGSDDGTDTCRVGAAGCPAAGGGAREDRAAVAVDTAAAAVAAADAEVVGACGGVGAAQTLARSDALAGCGAKDDTGCAGASDLSSTSSEFGSTCR